jgi:predicted DNA-binding protein
MVEQLTTYRTTCYIIYMLKTYLYIPDNLRDKITQTAQNQNKSKAEVIRQALEKGITAVSQQGTASAQALLRIKEVGKKFHPKGPKDLSAKLDQYLWGMKNDNE